METIIIVAMTLAAKKAIAIVAVVAVLAILAVVLYRPQSSAQKLEIPLLKAGATDAEKRKHAMARLIHQRGGRYLTGFYEMEFEDLFDIFLELGIEFVYLFDLMHEEYGIVEICNPGWGQEDFVAAFGNEGVLPVEEAVLPVEEAALPVEEAVDSHEHVRSDSAEVDAVEAEGDREEIDEAIATGHDVEESQERIEPEPPERIESPAQEYEPPEQSYEGDSGGDGGDSGGDGGDD